MNTRTLRTIATSRPVVANRPMTAQAAALRSALGPGFQVPVTERLLNTAARG